MYINDPPLSLGKENQFGDDTTIWVVAKHVKKSNKHCKIHWVLQRHMALSIQYDTKILIGTRLSATCHWDWFSKICFENQHCNRFSKLEPKMILSKIVLQITEKMLESRLKLIKYHCRIYPHEIISRYVV